MEKIKNYEKEKIIDALEKIKKSLIGRDLN